MDVFSIIGVGIGCLSLLVSTVVALKNSRKDFKAEVEDIAALKTDVAVLKERAANQGDLIKKAIDKLDEIREKL